MKDVYLLLGPEKGLKEDFIEKQIQANPRCSVLRFYAFDDYGDELFASLGNAGLFEEKKVIILYSAEELKTKQKVDPLVEYIKHPSEDVTLLIESPELYIHASLMSAVKPANVLKFYELFESKKSEWIRNFFSRNGMRVSPAASSAIIERVDNNISEFEDVCMQLALYVGGQGRGTVEERDVEDFLSHTKTETPFSLFSYIAKKDIEGALGCLSALLNLAENSTLGSVLAARLAVFFRRALSVKKLIAEGRGIDEAMAGKYFDDDRPIRMPRDKDAYRSAVSNYSPAGLAAALAILAKYDVEIREQGAFLQRIILDKMVLDLIDLR